MADKAKKVCKTCGYLSTEKVCENCGLKEFLPKYKGRALIIDSETSEIAGKIDAKKAGNYALKYGQN